MDTVGVPMVGLAFLRGDCVAGGGPAGGCTGSMAEAL